MKDVCLSVVEMGIRGLTTFVDTHPELLTDFRLHDTKIIVDGNNLYHFLYYYFQVPCEYGGDYNQFAKSCETFFAALHSCGVVPYVVFDGAYASDGNKFQTSLARARERVHMTNIVAHGRRAKILPILTHSCFIHVLRRLGVEYVTCDYEADRQIAALAQHWNCPVLTNDSDFFVYDIPAGVVLLDYLNLRSKLHHGHSKQHSDLVYRYLESQIFYCQKFMKYLRVDHHFHVVLFATLLGNDIVDGRKFDSFFSHVKLPKSHSRLKTSHRECKIAGLIAWLQSVVSVTDAVAYILSKLPRDHRKSVQSLMELSLEFYSEPASDLHEYFDVDQKHVQCVGRTIGECDLPDWFQIGVRRGAVPTAVLNILASQRLLLLSQIELSCEVSSYKCSQKLRQIAYGVALSATNAVANCVNEYDRDCKSLKMCATGTITQLNGKPVPRLTEVGQVDRRQRFLFLLEALDTPLDCVFDLLIPDVQFLVAVVRYWVHNANTKISNLHIRAVLLCLMKLGALDTYCLISPQSKSVEEAVRCSSWLAQTQKAPDRHQNLTSSSSGHSQSLHRVSSKSIHDFWSDRAESRLSVISDLTVVGNDDDRDLFVYIIQSLAGGLDISVYTDEPNDDALAQSVDNCRRAIDEAKEKLVQFDSAPHHNHAVVYNAAAVYAFAEFQTCFMSAGCVASLLGLTVHDPAYVFSGTVLYNLAQELQSRSNPDMYITELLGGSSSLISACYFQLLNAVVSGLPEGRLEVVGAQPKMRSKRSKKSRSAATADRSDELNPVLDDAQPVVVEEGFVVNCDVDNRFSGLSVTED